MAVEEPIVEDHDDASPPPSPTTTKPELEWSRLERTVEYVGKVKKESKRKVTWVLLHEPTQAMYKIILTWSVNSGKYTIHVNEKEEVFDRRQGASLLDHSFSIFVGGTSGTTRVSFRVVAARSVPARTPFVQYDLMTNGIKFHQLPGDALLVDEGLPSLADVVVVQSKE